jgi:hypothetical protein
MASLSVAPILAREPVSLRLESEGGIPWFVFRDGDGKAIATSDGPKGAGPVRSTGGEVRSAGGGWCAF